ncbi:MAG TPA: hypothetical protein VMN04_07650, partial [Thermoanaerobaculia bacterium]|nr:hypothetical protein [Thermoanaerobaculia bacterium]
MPRRIDRRFAQPPAGAAILLVLAVAFPAHSQKSPSSSRSSPKQKKFSPFATLEADYVRTFLNRFPVVATYLGASGLDPAYAALDGKLRD